MENCNKVTSGCPSFALVSCEKGREGACAGIAGVLLSFCFFSFVCLCVLLLEFCLFVFKFNLIFVLSGDKGDPRTRVWWKGAICEFTLRNPCLIWNSEFILGYNENCFHRGVPNFISANSLEIRLFEFDGPTQSLLQLQGRKVQNICPLFLIFDTFCVLVSHTFRLNS